jgi:hypothetical protein
MMDSGVFCRELIKSIREELIMTVETLPGAALFEYSAETIAGYLAHIFRGIDDNKIDVLPSSEDLVAFSIIACGHEPLSYELFRERCFIGYYLSCALATTETAQSYFENGKFNSALGYCYLAGQLQGNINGFKLGYKWGNDDSRILSSRKATDAQYSRSRDLLSRVEEIARREWENGSSLLHHQMKKYLAEEYQDDNKKHPFVNVPEKSILERVKRVAKEINRPDLISGQKKSK